MLFDFQNQIDFLLQRNVDIADTWISTQTQMQLNAM